MYMSVKSLIEMVEDCAVFDNEPKQPLKYTNVKDIVIVEGPKVYPALTFLPSSEPRGKLENKNLQTNF